MILYKVIFVKLPAEILHCLITSAQTTRSNEVSEFYFTQSLFHSVKLEGCVIRLRARGLIIVSIL